MTAIVGSGLMMVVAGCGAQTAAAALAAGPGGMRSLRRCGRPGGGGHRGALQGDDVPAVADGDPSPSAAIRGGRSRSRRGGDVDAAAADRVRHDHRAPGQLRWHRVAVAAVGHHRLARGGARRGHDHRIRLRGAGATVRALATVATEARRRRWRGGGCPRAGRSRLSRRLGLLDGGLVGQGAPPALRGSVIDLLHHALAVAAPRRADRHRHAVVLGHPGERCGHPPTPGARPWPSGRTATPGHPAQTRARPGRGRRPGAADRSTATAAPPLAGMGQRPDQQVRGLAPTPTMRADPAIPASPTGFHPRAGAGSPRSGGRSPAAGSHPGAGRGRGCCGSGSDTTARTRGPQLVEQGAGPQVRVLDQPGGHSRRTGRTGPGRPGPHPRCLFPSQVLADRLAVAAGVAGDRRDRPTTLRRACTSTSSSHVSMRKRASFELACGQTPAASKEARPSRRSHTGGEFR